MPELFWPSLPIRWALTEKSNSLPVSYDEKSCLVQTQVSCDFRRFQLTVRMRIRAWGLIQGKEQVELKQAQELFCLRELVVSSNPRSEPETAKMPFFLKFHSKRGLLTLWRDNQLDTSWYYYWVVDTELTLSWHWTGLRRRPRCHLHWHTMYSCYNCEWLSMYYLVDPKKKSFQLQPFVWPLA